MAGDAKVKSKTKDDFAIAVSESRLHIMVDDILDPTEVLELWQALKDGLFVWRELTGKPLDWKKLK